MAAALPFSAAELRFLRALLRRRVRFLVVGLSAATLQGAPVVTQDIDLWFEDLGDPALLQALREVKAAYVPPSVHNPPMLAGPGVELFDVVLRMDGLKPFAEEYRTSRSFQLGRQRLRVLPLARILASKLAADRPKDRLSIPVLRDSIATANSLRPSREPRKTTPAKAGIARRKRTR